MAGGLVSYTPLTQTREFEIGATDLPSCDLKRSQDKFCLTIHFHSEWFLPIL